MAKSKTEAAVATTEAPVAAPAGEEIVAPATEELIKVSGVASELLAGGLGISPISPDLPIEQRRDAIRQSLKEVGAAGEKLGLVEGELLFEVSKNGYWKDYEFTDEKGEKRKFASFEEYTQTELGMNRRKAFYLIDIYETYVVKLSLPKEVLGDLEWTKARELTKVITAENWSELLDKAKGMTVVQIQEMVKGMKSGTGTAADDGTAPSADAGDEMVKVAFKLAPAQHENVMAALALAESMTKSDKKGHNLDLICSDFVASAAGMGAEGALTKLDLLIKNIERTFGVKLTLSEVDPEKFKDLEAPAASV